MADSYQKTVESLWLTSRFLTILCGISLITNVILALAFVAFFPIQKVQPYYLQIDDLENKQVYLQKDLTMEQLQGDFIQKVLIKKYVLQREQFSLSPLKVYELWGPSSYLFYASTKNVYNEFVSDELYKQIIGSGNPKKLTRVVDIKSISYLESSGRYQVKGTITDYDQSGKVYINNEQEFEVFITCEFSKQKIYLPYKDRLKNPFGFVISKYEYNRKVSY